MKFSKSLLAAAAAVLFSSAAHAAGFTCLTDNSGDCASFESAFTYTVSGNLVTVYNGLGADAGFGSITAVYFEGPTAGAVNGSSVGVSFADGGSPPSLPAGNTAVPPFLTTYYATSTGNLDTGVQNDEFVQFTLTGGFTRIGLHVQDLGGGGQFSESLINTPPIPEPETYALMLAGLGVLGFVAKRRKAA